MRKGFSIMYILILIGAIFPTKVKATSNVSELNINSPSAILIEYSTGNVLYSKNENEKMYPASMTKMMSMYLLLDCIENKTHSFKDIVTVSEYASSMGGSQIFLKENEKMTFEDLFTSIAVASANDSTVALAEYTYGSVESFVDAMNKKAKELNMTNTNFINTTGFHDSNHYTTASDMGILAINLLKNHQKTLLKYTSIYETYLRNDGETPFWLVTTNKLLKTYEGMDGLKTGYTKESGYNLTATSSKNNLRFISVAMGAKTAKERNADIVSMLNYGFNNYKTITLYKENDFIKEVTINNSKETNIYLISKEDINVVIKKNATTDKLKISIDLFDNNAPKNKNEVIGILKVIDENGAILATYNLYISKEATTLSFLDIFTKFFKLII